MPVNRVAHIQRGAEAEGQTPGQAEKSGLRTWEGIVVEKNT